MKQPWWFLASSPWVSTTTSFFQKVKKTTPIQTPRETWRAFTSNAAAVLIVVPLWIHLFFVDFDSQFCVELNTTQQQQLWKHEYTCKKIPNRWFSRRFDEFDVCSDESTLAIETGTRKSIDIGGDCTHTHTRAHINSSIGPTVRDYFLHRLKRDRTGNFQSSYIVWVSFKWVRFENEMEAR